jgi:hypothetical protein
LLHRNSIFLVYNYFFGAVMEEKRNKCRSSAGKREGPGLNGRNRHILEDDIKTDLQK